MEDKLGTRTKRKFKTGNRKLKNIKMFEEFNLNEEKLTNAFVFKNGDVLDKWPCDVNPETGEQESNGGTENLIEYEDKKYLIVSDTNGDVILNPEELATEKTEDED